MRYALTYIKNVFCLEGEMGKDMRDRSGVRAALNFMHENFDVKFIYKSCSNRASLLYYIKRWKNRKYDSYSIGYFSFHGEAGKIEPGGRNFVTFDELGEMLKDSCEDKVIHFGTCETIKVDHQLMVDFLKKTKALCVSGYQNDVEFFESSVFDLIFIDTLQKYKDMTKVEEVINRDYSYLSNKLGFKMVY